MSAELARRLVHSGALPAKVEAALFTAQSQGISLCQAVHDSYPELVDFLDRALDHAEFPAVHIVRPLTDLVRGLPAGLCERLLAVPVHREARGERIDVAAVDVLDGHVASELTFHLKAPIGVVRASYPELTAALRRHRRTSASWPQLTLRRGWEDDPAIEPVQSVLRPKPLLEALGPPWALELGAALVRFERAESPEEVIAGLCEGLHPVRTLVFAVRSKSFEVRGGSAKLGTLVELRERRVPSGNGSLLDTAAHVGFYFGPFAQLAALSGLAGKWGVPSGGDCYARAVNVSERPSLIVLMAGFSESTRATRRADVLAEGAGRALERIVRARKKA